MKSSILTCPLDILHPDFITRTCPRPLLLNGRVFLPEGDINIPKRGSKIKEKEAPQMTIMISGRGNKAVQSYTFPSAIGSNA